MNNDTREFANMSKVLGTTITKSGFSRHALNRINLSKSKLNLLYRFIDLSPKIKEHCINH